MRILLTKDSECLTFYRGHGHSGDQENVHENVHENSYGMTKTEMSVYQSICNNPLAVASSIALEIGKSEKTIFGVCNEENKCKLA